MKSHWQQKRVVVYAALSVVLLNSMVYLGCSGGMNLYSKADDVALGRQVQAEIARDPRQFPVLNNPTVEGYVQNIVNTILTSPNIKNREFNYDVTIINDDQTVNAFSIPGGPMYVYTGLLKFLDNEATLAGIMAHEITHADERHATEQLSKTYGLQILASIALGQNAGALAEIAAGLAGNLAVMKFSRDAERQADAEGFKDLLTIPNRPWHPSAIRYFMIKTLNQQKSQPGKFENLFMTHPPSQERLDNVDKMAQEAGLPQPTESNLRSAELTRIKNMIGGSGATGK